ncbi:MAG TPA: hypothetical protein DD666_09280 [Advenella kashmirensis]|uniref:Uncharacterized protein n=1 Tax=Advenella kashmirensis TaxID=310575 RepID=A0A356LFA0_9BURK|nr:hypothetical protein [Advenella kashmirensis]
MYKKFIQINVGFSTGRYYYAWTFNPEAGSNPIRSKQGLSAVLKVSFLPFFSCSSHSFFIFFSSGVPAIRCMAIRYIERLGALHLIKPAL